MGRYAAFIMTFISARLQARNKAMRPAYLRGNNQMENVCLLPDFYAASSYSLRSKTLDISRELFSELDLSIIALSITGCGFLRRNLQYDQALPLPNCLSVPNRYFERAKKLGNDWPCCLVIRSTHHNESRRIGIYPKLWADSFGFVLLPTTVNQCVSNDFCVICCLRITSGWHYLKRLIRELRECFPHFYSLRWCNSSRRILIFDNRGSFIGIDERFFQPLPLEAEVEKFPSLVCVPIVCCNGIEKDAGQVPLRPQSQPMRYIPLPSDPKSQSQIPHEIFPFSLSFCGTVWEGNPWTLNQYCCYAF